MNMIIHVIRYVKEASLIKTFSFSCYFLWWALGMKRNRLSWICLNGVSATSASALSWGFSGSRERRWDSFKALRLFPALKETLSSCPRNKPVKRTNFIHLHPSGKARAAVLQTENEIWNQLWGMKRKSMSLKES